MDQFRIKKRLSIVVEDKTAQFFGHVGLDKLTLEGTVLGKKLRERSLTLHPNIQNDRGETEMESHHRKHHMDSGCSNSNKRLRIDK